MHIPAKIKARTDTARAIARAELASFDAERRAQQARSVVLDALCVAYRAGDGRPCTVLTSQVAAMIEAESLALDAHARLMKARHGRRRNQRGH